MERTQRDIETLDVEQQAAESEAAPDVEIGIESEVDGVVDMLKLHKSLIKQVGALSRDPSKAKELEKVWAEVKSIDTYIDSVDTTLITRAVDKLRGENPASKKIIEQQRAKLEKKQQLEQRAHDARELRREAGTVLPEDPRDVLNYFAQKRAAGIAGKEGLAMDESTSDGEAPINNESIPNGHEKRQVRKIRPRSEVENELHEKRREQGEADHMHDVGLREIKAAREIEDYPQTQKDIREYFAKRRAIKLANADRFAGDEDAEDKPARQEIVLPPLNAAPAWKAEDEEKAPAAKIAAHEAPKEEEGFETGLSSFVDFKKEVMKMNTVEDLAVLQQNLETRQEAYDSIREKIGKTDPSNVGLLHKLKGMKREQELAKSFINDHMRMIEVRARAAALSAKKPAPKPMLQEVRKPEAAAQPKRKARFGLSRFFGISDESRDAA